MNLLLISMLVLGVIQLSNAQVNFGGYNIRNVDDQMTCTGSPRLTLEYVQFTNPVTGEIKSPCYPNALYSNILVNRKIWHIDVLDAVAYRLTVDEFVGGYGDDAPALVLYYTGNVQQDPGAPSIVLVETENEIFGSELVPESALTSGKESLTRKEAGVSTPLSKGDTFDFTGDQMFFTVFHNLESVTGQFKLTYEPDINQCRDPAYCQNGGTCSRAGFKDYRCACTPQWEGDRCQTDVNECARDLDNCSPFATCTNLQGSFSCACNEGYFGNGVTCEAIVCSALATPAFGNIPSCTSDANYNSVCTFSCTAGYSISGSATLTCGAGDGSSALGSWSSVAPTCVPFQCPGLPVPVNGAGLACTDGSNFNSACTFTCAAGFGIVGERVLTCTSQGSTIETSYNFAVPTCEAIVCPVLTNPINGNTPSCTNANQFGSVCSFTCGSGFILEGSAQVTCEGDGLSTVGAYSLASPTCRAITCIALTAPVNGAAVDCTASTNYGSVCTFRCNAGYGLVGASVLTCGSGAVSLAGTGYDFASPTCEAIVCPVLTAPVNGNTPTCSATNAFNSVCTFTCAAGFSLVGQATLTCEGDGSSANGVYNFAAPTCQAITCPLLAVPINGESVSCSGATAVGVQCTFVCSPGFGISGAAVLTCVGGGSVTGNYDLPAPTCLAITCPEPAPIVNGGLSCDQDNAFGSICTTTCNAGFSLQGSATTTCDGDGSSVTGAFNTAFPTCVAITCDALTAPANGIVDAGCTSSQNFGATCTFTCNAGFTLVGVATLVCQGTTASTTGSYSAAAPTCTDFDECLVSTTNNCNANARCDNTVGSYTCTCNTGYEGNGVDCANVNECLDASLNNCDANAACADTIGSYTCTCNTGFAGDGFTCTNINECAGANICGANAVCTDTIGSYTCACAVGYAGDGIVCTDINECLDTSVCDVNAICLNVEGSYSCNCNAGYTGSGIPGDCQDINECTDATSCSANAVCSNTVGSFTCDCAPGFTRESGDGGPPTPESLICVDINECATGQDNCNDALGICTNTVGSFTCACKVGYAGDGVVCVDVDECAVSPGPCRPLATCTNTVGSFTCACGSGFCGDGITSCLDVDECSDTDANDCDVNARCDNLPGSFDCTCAVGYAGDGKTSCVPAGLQPGEIAAIVVCSIIALALIVLLVVYLIRKK